MIAAALLACAVNVAPATMSAIIGVESGGNPIAINVNKLNGPQPKPASLTDAIVTAKRYIALGYSVDIGLAQLNSRNLARFRYSVEDAFNPCKSIAAGGAVLSGFYSIAVRQYGEGQRALMSALSGYNTGDLARGISNGYVSKYYISAPLPVMPSPQYQHQTVSTPVIATGAQIYVRPGLTGRSEIGW